MMEGRAELVLLGLLSLLSVSTGQVPFLGPCTPVSTVADFDFVRYLGRWYEAERYFSLLEFAGKCVTTNITDSSSVNHTMFSVITEQTSWLTNIHSTYKGQMRPLDQFGDTSKMYIRYLPMDLTTDHWVLATDYENYAVVYSCMSIGSIFSTRSAWILTRARTPTLEVMEKAYSVLDKNGISRAFFIRVDQTDNGCPEYRSASATAATSAPVVSLASK